MSDDKDTIFVTMTKSEAENVLVALTLSAVEMNKRLAADLASGIPGDAYQNIYVKVIREMSEVACRIGAWIDPGAPCTPAPNQAHSTTQG